MTPTPSTLAALQALEAKATKGPWTADKPSFKGGELSGYVFGPDCAMVADECHGCDGVRIRGVGGKLPMRENAELIAAARNHLPLLLHAASRYGQIQQLRARMEMGAQMDSVWCHALLRDLLALVDPPAEKG